MRWLLLLPLLLLGGCGSTSEPSPAPAAWTLMFYIAADNDLEDAQMTDLLEILAAGSAPGIQLTALVDRSPKGAETEGYSAWQIPGQGNWTGARWLTLVDGQARLIADWEYQNTADGSLLSRFLQQSVQRYPAQHYALFIADHGEAWKGICVDDYALEDDLLELSEISAALQQAGFTPQRKLDLLAFDACLMGSLEVACALAPHVRFLVASEETVPWSGFCYRQPLERLQRRPQASALTLGRWLIDAYRDTFAQAALAEAREEGQLATLSLLDLSHVEPVAQSVARLAQILLHELQRQPGAWLKLARIRARAEEFGPSDEPTQAGAHQRDLGQLAQLLAPLPGCRQVCQELRRGLRALVLDSFAGAQRPHASGLAIFFPPDQEALLGYDFGPWAPLLERYVALERQDRSRPDLSAVARSGEFVDAETAITLQARLGRPDSVEQAWLVLVEDGWIVGRQPTFPEEGSSYLEDVFDHTWMTLSVPGAGSRLCSIQEIEETDPEKELFLARLPAQWRRGPGRWQEVNLAVLLDFSQADWHGQLQSVTRSAGSLRRPVALRAGDELRLPRERLRDPVREYGPGLKLGRPQDLRLSLQPLPVGRYQVGFAIRTYTGQRACRTVGVEVE